MMPMTDQTFQQQQTSAFFGLAYNEPRSDQKLDFSRADVRVVSFSCRDCSTDKKSLQSIYCTDYNKCTDKKDAAMRKVKYRNAEYVENHSAMNLHHAGKSLATGRKVRGLWLLTAKGFCWIDPDARKPNAIGVVEPRLMVKKSKATARHELQQIALLL